MYIGVFNYLVGMEILTIIIANIDILRASCDDSSCEMTKGVLIVTIDREW